MAGRTPIPKSTGSSRHVSSRADSKVAGVRGGESQACSNLKFKDRPQITRVELLSLGMRAWLPGDDATFPAKRRDTSGRALYVVAAAGIAEIEFAVSEDESADDKFHVATALSSPASVPLDKDGSITAGQLEALPPKAANILVKLASRTQQLRTQAARLEKALAPTHEALSYALLGAVPPEQPPLPPRLVTGPAGVEAWGSGVGHPLLRLLQRRACGNELQDLPAVQMAAELVGQEFFSQFLVSNGTVALTMALELTRIMLASTASAKAEPTDESNLFSTRERWLQSLHPELLAMRSSFCVTRAESPGIHLNFAEVGIVQPKGCKSTLPRHRRTSGIARALSKLKKDAKEQARPDSPQSIPEELQASFPQRDSLSRGCSLEISPREESYVRYDCRGMREIIPPEKNPADSTNITLTGARRMEFWDGFFAYRALGVVSKELAAEQLQKEEEEGEDEEEDATRAKQASYMYKLSPGKAHHGPLNHPLVSPFSKSLQPETGKNGASLNDKLFPSLGQRRRCRHLAALRRPPGSTADVGPGDSPERQAGSDVQSEFSPVAGAKSALGLQRPTSDTSLVSQELDNHGVKDAPSREPWKLPMFMGMAAATQTKIEHEQREQALPFVNSGVGFEVQPLTAAKDRVAADRQQKVETKHGKRIDDRNLESPLFVGLDKGTDNSTTDIPRCRYCIHHSISPCAPAMAEVFSQKAEVRQHDIMRRSLKKTREVPTHLLCFACGGDVNAPFTVKPPKLLLQAYMGETPCTLSPRGTRSPRQRAGRRLEDPLAMREKIIAKPPTVQTLSSKLAVPQEDILSPSARLPTRSAAVPYELPVCVLSDHVDTDKNGITNVYFMACERNHARPIPDGASALRASGVMASATGMTDTREQVQPRLTDDQVDRSRASQGVDVRIAMRGTGLDDKGLDAFIEALTQKSSNFGSSGGIHIDFAGNQLTDAGVHRLLSRLEEPFEWAKRLESLDLSRNRLLSARAIEPLCGLLNAEKLGRLRVLRLGGIELTETLSLQLFKGIDAAASSNLEELDISFLGIGKSGPAGPMAAAALVRQCYALCTLDISGNHLNFDALAALGRGLSEGGCVQTLHVAYNTGNWPVVAESVPPKQSDFTQCRRIEGGGDVSQLPFAPSPCTAVSAVCEHLSRVQHLRVLDLRDSQVDPRCAFILACALSKHKTIEAVLLNGNPLGVYGVRALFSIAYLADPPQGATPNRLSVLTLEQCMETSMLASDAPPLSPADPSGSYVFDMRDPCSNAAVQYCLQAWSKIRSQLSFEQAFPYIELDGRPVKEVAQSPDGRWDLPRTGTLSFTFLLPNNSQCATLDRQDGFRVRPQDHHRRHLTPFMEERVLQIASMCRSQVSLEAVAHSLAADFCVRGAVVTAICKWMCGMGMKGTADRLAAAETLCDSVSDTECELELWALLAVPRLLPSPAASIDRGSTVDFVVSANPTGHYVLNLAWPSERIVAEDLLLLSNWAAEMGKASCLPDISQKGNYQCLRNESLDTKSFVYRPDWVLPTSGILELDLVVPRRLPRTAKLLDEESLQKLKTALVQDTSPVMLRVLCLRRLSPKLCLSCQQALSIFAIFTEAGAGWPSQVKLTLLSILIFRVRDYPNIRQNFFKSPGPFSGAEKLRYCEQFLGCLTLADSLHLNLQLQLDLAVHEERQYCRMVLNIAYQEGGRALDPKSFVDCTYGSGYPDLRPFTNGAPPDRWVKSGLPQRGVIVMTYTGEDSNSVRFRRRQQSQICGWEL